MFTLRTLHRAFSTVSASAAGVATSAAATPTAATSSAAASAVRAASTTATKPRVRRSILTLTPRAVDRVKELALQDSILRIGVKKKGCSGLQYSLDYVKEKQKLDEEVVQDGARVLIESKALFTILGSEMDFVTDRLRSQFVFHNPNVKESCGCGESFMV